MMQLYCSNKNTNSTKQHSKFRLVLDNKNRSGVRLLYHCKPLNQLCRNNIEPLEKLIKPVLIPAMWQILSLKTD